MKHLQILGLVVTAGLVAGCDKAGKAPAMTNVSGTVTLNGKPLAKGKVTFSTDGRPPVIIDIHDGNYAGQAMAGSNRVQVSSTQPVAAARNVPADVRKRMEQEKISAEEEIIPAEWNSKSNEIRVVEVGGANKFDFDIKSKK